MTTYAFDPELAPIVPLLPSGSFADIKAARELIDGLVSSVPAPPPDPTIEVTDRLVPGFEGDPDVSVRVYRPTTATTPTAAVLYIHGGGFAVGSVETEHAGALGLAGAIGATVVSVEYRLAPEHPFPAGLHDCYAALVWLAAEADELGVDTSRIAVSGQSAGGGLSAALALFARDRGGPALCFQFLGIPELDDRLDTPSMRAFVDTPMWHRPNAELSWQYYLGDPKPAEVSIYAAPARATDLAGLPPAYISTMEFDPLRDEGIRYACALLEAGVSTELHSFAGTFHGSVLVTTAGISRVIAQEQIRVLRTALQPS